METKTLKEIIKENDARVVAVLCDESQGSGFFILPGIIVTNEHVVHNQKECKIRMVDGSIFNSEGLIAYSSVLDLAIIKMEEPIGKPVVIGDSNRLSKGDSVVAIGSPLGLFNTVTVGIHANKLNDGDIKRLQNSIPLAPGNSGGALFNESGELVGINTAIADGYADISFAVSSSHLTGMIKELSSVEFVDIDAIPIDQIEFEQY